MSKKEAAQASVRSRAASPGATGAKAAKAKAGPAEGKPATPAAKSELEILEGLPPQLGALALGSLGLARAWAVGGSVGSGAISSALSLAALLFLAIYSMKLLRPSALWRDASDASALPPLGAFFAAAQGVGVRYLVPELAQLVIVVTHGLMLLVSIRFAWVNAKKGLRPDPSWFPGLLLSGFTSVSASALGPWWLKAAVPLHFWSSIAIYVPVKLVVIYRLFLSPARSSVAANAGMATFMAPGSFFTVVHLTSGKPGGDLMGLLLFADSTISFLATVGLLYIRRSVWSSAFHVSYVAFTFPLASTATAALLSSERLMDSSLLVAWAWLLLLLATGVILAVQFRFLRHLLELRRKQK